MVKNKGCRASDCFFVHHIGSHLTSPVFHLSKILSYLTIVSKNENIYLMYVAQCLAHECSTAAINWKTHLLQCHGHSPYSFC